MADFRFNTIGRWAAGTACAAVATFALAQPPHGGHGGFWPGAGAGFALRGQFHAQRGGGEAPAAARQYGVRRSPGWGIAPSPNRYWQGGSREALTAAGAPVVRVSDDARAAPRAGGNNVNMRAGSIRADIARYNEERAPNRPVPRPPNAGQRSTSYAPDPFLYRN